MSFFEIADIKLSTSGCTAEIVHYDHDSIQVNLMDRNAQMHAKIQIAEEDGKFEVRIWQPKQWLNKEPQQVIRIE